MSRKLTLSQAHYLLPYLLLIGLLVGYYEFRRIPQKMESDFRITPMESPSTKEKEEHDRSGSDTPSNSVQDTRTIRLSQQAMANLGIQTTQVDVQNLTKVLEVPGVIKLPPDRITNVSPRISARVEEILIKPGDKVEVGQKLATLRSLEIENLHVELDEANNRLKALEASLALRREVLQRAIGTELERNRIELISAINKVKLAKQNAERAKDLSDKILPAKEIQIRESEYAVALGELEGVKKKLKLLGLSDDEIDRLSTSRNGKSATEVLAFSLKELAKRLTPLESAEVFNEFLNLEAEYRSLQVEIEGKKRRLEVLGHPPHPGSLTEDDAVITLTSPLNGTVTRIDATLGEVVEPGKILFQVVDSKGVYAEGDISVENVSLVKRDQEVRVRVTSYPDEVFPGKILYVSDIADPAKRTIHILVEVANPDRKLKPEMFATLFVVVEKSDEVLAVSRESILTEGVEQYVFVRNGTDFIKQTVVTGISNDQYVEIKDGLFLGDEVVTQGAYELNVSLTQSTVQSEGDGHGGHTH